MRIHAKTSMTLLVRTLCLGWQNYKHGVSFIDGGWLKSHPLPADKGSFGIFDALSQQNRQLIQSILESNSSTSPVSVAASSDDQVLGKLRGLYSSCMDEDKLNDIGTEPLLHFVGTVRRLFRGESTDIIPLLKRDEDEGERNLTAALAFLHSRG